MALIKPKVAVAEKTNYISMIVLPKIKYCHKWHPLPKAHIRIIYFY